MSRPHNSKLLLQEAPTGHALVSHRA